LETWWPRAGDESEALDYIVGLGGAPEDVTADPEAMSVFFSPVFYDIRLLQLHRHTPRPILESPITAIGGLADPLVSESNLREWGRYTSDFNCVMLEGGHFLVQQASEKVARCISDALRQRGRQTT
jgi:surfactin synthase thioesterase subunit